MGKISWFARSCGRKPRVPLELRVDLGDLFMFPQGNQIFFGVARAPWDSLCITAGMNRASSREDMGTSGFLSIFDIDLGVSAELE